MPGRAVTLSSDPAHSRGPGSPPRCDPLTGLAVQVGGGRQASLSHLPAAPCVSRGSRRPALRGFPSSCTSLCQVSGSGSTCSLELSRPPVLPPPLPHQAPRMCCAYTPRRVGTLRPGRSGPFPFPTHLSAPSGTPCQPCPCWGQHSGTCSSCCRRASPHPLREWT